MRGILSQDEVRQMEDLKSRQDLGLSLNETRKLKELAMRKLKSGIATTKHTCGEPEFGRLTAFGKLTMSCPRCNELWAGSRPIQWVGYRSADGTDSRIAELRVHDCKKAGCGPVCTFGEW